jgi:TetR/AcrR family transcriptional repressor of nem operon
MRVTREQFLENREKILEAAGRLFRERGFSEVSVAEIMQAAGLTHGGFYGHFKSKEDLIVQAAQAASAKVLERWGKVAQSHPEGALRAFADIYLSHNHMKGVGAGCLVAALGPEVARQPEASRASVTASLKDLVVLMQTVAPGETEADRRRRALAAYASWIGAMVLARISDDEAFSKEVLDAVRT